MKKFVCTVCGYIHEGEAPPARCPQCNAPASKFPAQGTKEIAAELDCSYQLVGKRGRTLAERDLLSRAKNEQGRRDFEISEFAEEIYFRSVPDDQLDFGAD